MTEKLAVDQVFRQSTAIHSDERSIFARRRKVNRVGDQLLAGPGLAEDEHGVVERRHLAHHLHYIAQPRITTDDPVRGVTVQLPVQEALVVQQYGLVAEHLLVSEGVGKRNRKRLRKAAGELKKFFAVSSLSRCL